MANLTYYSANKIQDYILGNVSFTNPTIWYLGISSTAPQVDGTGVTEPTTDPSYERVVIANNKISFSSASSGEVANIASFQFVESSINQGVVTHWVLYDALTGGNMWQFGNLTNSRTVEISTTLLLPIGRFTSTAE